MNHNYLQQIESAVKDFVRRLPFAGTAARKIHKGLTGRNRRFSGSRIYWEDRYALGGNSGVGSYGNFAEFKAEVINSLVGENNIGTVIEFGCGDGNQLLLANYPEYRGFDVSPTAVALCLEKFGTDRTKSFHSLGSYSGETADLALSLDVIYHLIEDEVFESYMRRLFDSATHFVVIYSSNTDQNEGYENTHVKHRRFTRWVQDNAIGWSLERHIPNRYPYDGDYTQGSFADFFIYRKN